MNGDMERKIEKLKKQIEGGKKEKMMIGGDFNARTGIRKRKLGVEKEEERERRSDKKTNKEGWKLLEAIGKVGIKILNESVQETRRESLGI